ncbi:MAG TPA: hypothetical protein VM124_03180 [Candidatus Limnocylindrales bacterium]|nr:hypothetical protein [Candidatus Limnocylindrales bacterium]
MRLILGTLALALNLIGYFPYIRDIIRGKVRPQRITWGIWSILTAVAAVNQVLNGGEYSSLYVVSGAILVSTTFILSIKYGVGGTSALDRVCLVLAFGLVVYWISAQDTRISTLLVVIIDSLGAIPTLVKTYHHPETETYIQWSLAGIAGLITVATVPEVDWALIIYPAYVFTMNAMIVSTKYMSEHKKPAAV